MADLHVDFLGKRLAGPVIAASGTFGFGPEYAGIEDLRVLGGISGKGLTLSAEPRCAALYRPRAACHAPVRHHRLGEPRRPHD